MALFGAFLENGNKHILMSLPGVGAFQNDINVVITILKELLTDEDAPFKDKFASITFNVYSAQERSYTPLEEFVQKFPQQKT